MPSSEIPSAGGELKQLDGKDNCFTSVLARRQDTNGTATSPAQPSTALTHTT